MHRKLRICLALLILPLCTAVGAQNMYKCKDAAGKITYAGKECELLGLIDAGAVTGRATVQPALPTPVPSAAPSAPRPYVRPAAPAEAKAKVSEEPERRCFTVKTAKGIATRCNEVPESEPDKK